MRISVLTETSAHERRVALVPDAVGRLVKAGLDVVVQRGAGRAAGHLDEAYTAAGATLADDAAAAVAGADLVLKVQPPSEAEAERLPAGSALVSLLHPATNAAVNAQLAGRGVRALALELVPRITRAQSMDALSSMATIAGYKAVVEAASHYGRFFPGQMMPQDSIDQFSDQRAIEDGRFGERLRKRRRLAQRRVR